MDQREETDKKHVLKNAVICAVKKVRTQDR